MNRHDHIVRGLQQLEDRGIIDEPMIYTPDGRTRWALSGRWGMLTLTTREAEIFVAAANAAIEHDHGLTPVCQIAHCRNRIAIPGNDLCGVHLGTDPEDWGTLVDEAYERTYK